MTFKSELVISYIHRKIKNNLSNGRKMYEKWHGEQKEYRKERPEIWILAGLDMWLWILIIIHMFVIYKTVITSITIIVKTINV